MSGPVCLVAAANAVADIKAQAEFVCDGTADQVEINAALARDDKRPIFLAGIFFTTGPIQFNGTPFQHDLLGISEDNSQIVANHAGNVIELHATASPQEWRITLVNFLIRTAGTKPTRGISIQNGAFVTLEAVRIAGVTTGLYSSFGNTNTFDRVSMVDCGTGLHLTGTTGHASHFNTFRRCTYTNNDVGIQVETRAQMNAFDDCGINTRDAKGIGVRVMANATECEGNRFDHCWFEGPGVPFDIQGGDRLTVRDCRFAVPGTVPLVAQAGFNATNTRFERPIVENARQIAMCPQGVTFS
jgi:hypothetical protein